jgi:uncharacterized protein (DUF983 family)
VLVGIVAFGLAVWYGLRRSRAAARQVEALDRAGRWLCPHCDSAEVQRLPANFFTKHPGYLCKACGLRMRRANSTLFYVVLLVTTLALGSIIVVGVCTEGPPPMSLPELLDPHKIMMALAMPVGVVYLVLQLSRPTPKLREEPLYEGADQRS